MGELYKRAEAFARRAHGDSLGKNGRLFIEHPLAVAARFDDEVTKCAAVLHDTVEKTSASIVEIEVEFGSEVAFLVDNLTVRMGETQEATLLRALQDPRSTAIRIVDALNHADIRSWDINQPNFDITIVGSYIEKVEGILRAVGLFRTDSENRKTQDDQTGIVANNKSAVLNPSTNKLAVT